MNNKLKAINKILEWLASLDKNEMKTTAKPRTKPTNLAELKDQIKYEWELANRILNKCSILFKLYKIEQEIVLIKDFDFDKIDMNFKPYKIIDGFFDKLNDFMLKEAFKRPEISAKLIEEVHKIINQTEIEMESY